MHIHTNSHSIVDCGAPLSTSDDTIRAVYNSTLEGSQLELSCRDAITAAVCSTSGMWIPDPNMHTCRSITSDSDSSGRSIIMLKINFYTLFFLGDSLPMTDGDVITVAVISSIIMFIFSATLFFFIGCASGWFVTSTKLIGRVKAHILKLLQCMKIYDRQHPYQDIGRKRPLNSKRTLPMAQYNQLSNDQFILVVIDMMHHK